MARGGMTGLPQDQVTGSVARFVADAVMTGVELDVGLIGTAPPQGGACEAATGKAPPFATLAGDSYPSRFGPD